jgi:hypothetical protein
MKTIVSLFIFLLFFHPGFSQMRQVYIDTANTNNDIRKVSFFSPAEGYIASSGSPDWVAYTSDSGHTFVRKPINLSNVDFNGYLVNLTFGFSIEGVKAFSKDILIAYGDYGWVPAILYSSNGGASFKLVYHSQYDPYQLSTGIMDMVFPQNGSTGYAVDADRILKTTNKGLTWTVIRADPNSFFQSLIATDDNNVIAYSTEYNASKLLKTSNGGTSWTSLPIPATTSVRRLISTYFLTPAKGWVTVMNYDQEGEIYYTKDGGATWTQMNNSKVTPFLGGNLRFVNDSTGYALGGIYTVCKTTDSGKVWQPLPRNNAFNYLGFSHNDLQCWDADQLWAGGGRDFLELSTNGGGRPLPKAFFDIDTTGLSSTRLVQLVNYSKPGYQYKWFVNNVLTGTSYHSSYTHSASSTVDSIKLVVIDGAASDTVTRYQYFSVAPSIPVPIISAFTPASASTDFVVTITGTNFTGASAVRFGGVDARSFTVVSSTTITAIVAGGASGEVSVTTNYGTAKLGGFTYTTRLKITGFTPAAGAVGSTVYINGSNFSAALSGNHVRIGGIIATVVSASPNQIAVKVPTGTGYERISVTVNGATAYSNLPFIVTFPGGCDFDSTALEPKVEGSVDISPANIITADLDNDGRADVITANNNGGNRLTYLRNNSTVQTISFGSKQYLQVDAGGYATPVLCITDLDGDGRQDICAVNNGSFNGLVVFRNTSTPGAISFASPYNHADPFSDVAGELTVADFDGDGKPDIAANWSQGLKVFQNKSSNGVIALTDVLLENAGNGGGQTYDCAVADVNGDGKPDIFVSSNFYQHPKVSVYLNISTNEKISFTKPVDFSLEDSDTDNKVIAADIDGDGKADIVVLQRRPYSTSIPPVVSVFRNTSSGSSLSFAPRVDVTVGTTANDISAGDMNGDGKADLLIGYSYTTSASILINNSTPGAVAFATATNIGSEAYPFSFVARATDMNLDGKPDIVSLNVHLNTTTYATAPTATVFKNKYCNTVPLFVCEGSSTTLGSNISGTSYKWQQNTGSGFVDLVDGGNFSGANTRNLQIIGIPAAFNSYQFRCLVNDSSNSSVFVLYAGVQLTPAVSISAPATTICPNASLTFTATPLYGGTNPSYQWKVNGVAAGNTGASFTATGLKDNDQVQVSMTSNASCLTTTTASSNVLTIRVSGTPVAPSVSITADTTSICSGGSVHFTANTLNGGSSPVYQWQVNGANAGTNSDVFTTTSLTNGSQVKLIMNSSAACASPASVTSNIITIAVNSVAAPSVTITNSGGSVCAGTNIVFTATAVNAGINPTYQWQVNGINVGTNSPTYSSSTLKNTDAVKLILTSSAPCVSHDPVSSNVINTYWINPYPTANAGPDQTICGAGSVNIGTPAIRSYTYFWTPTKGLDLSTIAQPSAHPDTTTTYIVYVYNGCYSTDTVTVFVTPAPPAPVVTQSGDVLYSSANTGNQWYENGNIINGATSSSYTPTTGGMYSVVVTVNGCTNTSNQVNYVVTVNNPPNPPVVDPKLEVLPNPVTDKLLIRYKGNGAQFRFRLIGVNGKDVLEEGYFTTDREVDMKKYVAGLYVLQIVNVTSGEQTRIKVIKL